MKFKTTIILFGIFLILLIFVYIFEFKTKSKTDEEEKLVALSLENIQKITFIKEEETYSFYKDEKGDWFIIEPLEAKADNYEVNRFTEDFSELKIERVAEEEPQNLEKYKIPQKEIHIWVRDNDKPIKILVGMENPLDNTFFAQRADETRVVLIPSDLKSMMEKSLFDFRQKDIFTFETEKVKNIKFRAKKTRWEAKKKGEEWFFTKPIKALARKNKISDMLSSFSNLKAKEFVSEEKSKDEIKNFGLNHPDYEITLSLPVANQEVTFSLHKEDETLCATTSLSSKIIAVEDTILSDLEKEAQELREKEVANFHSWEANKLYLKKGELNLTVAEDKDNNWHFESPSEGNADKNKIQTFIRKIESLEATEFIDPPLSLKDYGLDNPQGEIKIWVGEDEGKTKEISIFIGPENKETKKVVVKNARLDYLFRVDSAFLDEFPKDIKDWIMKEEEEKERDHP